jgi:Fe-S-cluster-containing dehydrogenase component
MNDQKEQMRADLARALKKPEKDRSWGMFIDPEACSGCRACMVSCRTENALPPGVAYIVVLAETRGVFPYTRRRYLPKPCLHCAHPTCVMVCPVDATYRTPDGIVVMDYMKCIGCRYCLTACPYASRSFDVGDSYADGLDTTLPYEKRPSREYGRVWKREHHVSPIGNARKCHYCMHRLHRGLLPACVEACPTSALVFGDQTDPDSLVEIQKSFAPTHRLKEDLGNEPQVWYRI